MPCCGRPDNRAKKSRDKSYFEKYAYLSSSQKRLQTQLEGSKCEACDALTVGDPCSVCGKSKTQSEAQEPPVA